MVGIGYRKEFSKQFLNENTLTPDFIEVAPENWMSVGGYWKHQFDLVREKYPLFLHGLSLSIGSPEGVDKQFVQQIKQFIEEVNPKIYSEHLSFTKVENAHLYDLLPIPFTKDAVRHVVDNIKEVQDILGCQLTLENSSYYTVLKQEMPEYAFIQEITEQANCSLLLDVNNVYVNAFNHGYDAEKFLQNIPLNRVKYIHIAGHKKVSDSLIIDTHGSDIIDPVFRLFEFTMKQLKRDVPVLLERDFNIPELHVLQKEITTLRNIKEKVLQNQIIIS